MSLHIDSEDHTSGTRYDGVWTLSNKIRGTYELISQNVDVQDIPWCWTNTNHIHITSGQHETDFFIIDPVDLSEIQYETDKTVLADYFETRLNYIGTQMGFDAFTMTCTYNSAGDTFRWVFNKEITIHWSDSACRGWFNKMNSEDDTGSIWDLNAIYITVSPQFLYCTINEVPSYYITTNQTYPQLIFSTSDTAVTGQQIRFTSTNTLTIQIYLPNVMYSPVPLTSTWEVLFNPVSSF